jgi:hypothetical protein
MKITQILITDAEGTAEGVGKPAYLGELHVEALSQYGAKTP